MCLRIVKISKFEIPYDGIQALHRMVPLYFQPHIQTPLHE